MNAPKDELGRVESPRALRPRVVVLISLGVPILAVALIWGFVFVAEELTRPRNLEQARAAYVEAVAEVAQTETEAERAKAEAKRAEAANFPNLVELVRAGYDDLTASELPRAAYGDAHAARRVRAWLVRSAAAGDEYTVSLLDSGLPDVGDHNLARHALGMYGGGIFRAGLGDERVRAAYRQTSLDDLRATTEFLHRSHARRLARDKADAARITMQAFESAENERP